MLERLSLGSTIACAVKTVKPMVMPMSLMETLPGATDHDIIVLPKITLIGTSSGLLSVSACANSGYT